MPLKLSHKLFIAHSLIICSLVLAFLAFSYKSNQSLLSNAMNGVDEKVIEELGPILAQQYQAQGSFNFLVGDQDQWNSLVDGNFLRVFFSMSPKLPKPSPAKKVPTSELNTGQPSAPALPACEPPFPTFLQRLSLLDKNKTVLITAPKPAPDTYEQPIKLNGQIIGWLNVGKINVDALPLAGYFFHQQLVLTIWASVIAGVFAIGLGFLLSRQITLPILTITQQAQRLAKRDFDINIQVNTRDELHSLAQHINVIAAELKQFSSRQQQWLMDISHELRTPLTILYGELRAILDNVSEFNSETLHSLHEEVVYLKRLVDDLHSLAALDNLEFRHAFAPVNMGDFFAWQLARYNERFSKASLGLHTVPATEAYWVNGDKDRLAQVLRNLLENNLRYTQAPGDIYCSMQREHDTVLICLEDTGPGVAPELYEKLFDRLYRVDSARTRLSGGAGLGLSICRTIVGAHQGDITAHPSNRGGVKIIIRLPLIQAKGSSDSV